MAEEKIDYNFRCINPVNYECLIKIHPIKNKILRQIFKTATIKLKRKKNITIKGDPDNIQQFEIPNNYFPTLKMIIRKPVAAIRKEVNADGIEIIEYNISRADFTRIKEDWQVNIWLSGIWSKKS